MGCVVKAPDLPEKSVYLRKIQAKWGANPAIKAWGFDDNNAVIKDVFHEATGKELYVGQDIEMKDLRKFDIAIDDLVKDLKGEGMMNLNDALVKHLFVGSAKAAKNPLSRKFRKDLININNYKTRHHQELHNHYQDMIKHLKDAIVSYDLGVGSKEIWNRLTDKEQKYTISSLKNKSKTNFNDDLKILLKFLDNEGKVFQDFIEVVTEGRANYKAYPENYKKNVKGGRGEHNTHLLQAASAWREIQNGSKKILVDSMSNLIKLVDKKRGKDSPAGKKLIEEYSKIQKQLKEYKDNYVPHYVLDLLGESIKTREALHGKDALETKELESFFLRQADVASNINNQLLDRLKKPGKQESEYFSRNPMLYAHRYLADVVKFNFSTALDVKLSKTISDLSKAYADNNNTADIQGTAKAVEDLVMDMHSKAINGTEMSESVKNYVRIATSIGFASKLGFSTRGALRNATQVLQEFTYFGAKGLYEAKKFYENSANITLADDELAAHGLRFEDPSKFAEGALLQKDLSDIGIDIQDGHMYYSDKKTILDKAADITTKVAEKSASLIPLLNMKTIENWNRRHTFKTAFAIGYNKLEGQYKEMRTINKDVQKDRFEELKRKRVRQAGKFAANMVSEIHYEYAPWEKSRLLTTAGGAVLGQFQHYGLSFLNYQAQILKKAGRDIQAGDYLGENAWRMYRLFSMYAIAEGLSWIGNADITSLFNNDTIEKIKELHATFFGDPDERDEVFYGKGPVIGLAGAVPFSDLTTMINIGGAKGYYDLSFSEDNTLAWLAGIRDWSNKTGDELAYERARTLSTAFARLRYNTLPAIRDSGYWQAAMVESGLFPTKNTRDWHDVVFGTKLGVGKKQRKHEESLAKGTTKERLEYLAQSRKAALQNLSQLV